MEVFLGAIVGRLLVGEVEVVSAVLVGGVVLDGQGSALVLPWQLFNMSNCLGERGYKL